MHMRPCDVGVVSCRFLNVSDWGIERTKSVAEKRGGRFAVAAYHILWIIADMTLAPEAERSMYLLAPRGGPIAVLKDEWNGMLP
jgi:hypothetical protein